MLLFFHVFAATFGALVKMAFALAGATLACAMFFVTISAFVWMLATNR